jgi:hypothetical protein
MSHGLPGSPLTRLGHYEAEAVIWCCVRGVLTTNGVLLPER